MANICRIPAYGWRPRPHQMPAWKYLENGGRHAELICHRRWGKDELALHHAACSVVKRPANYWHMLPMASQVRKAIWTAVNPHTNRRRILEAFPAELRMPGPNGGIREQEMMIEFRNGATWQALGSDNYQGAIGSSPAGIVYSEWAQANPASRGYLRPILTENKGWQLYITTPRGDNHAKRTYEGAMRDPDAFAMLQTIEDSGAMTPAEIEKERQAYIDDYGPDVGLALFEQEYYCSFSAVVIGAFYAGEFARMEREGRLGYFPHVPGHLVYTAWDLGHTDDTAVWWFQIIDGRVRIIDFLSETGQGMAFYAGHLIGREVELTIDSYKVTAEFGADLPSAIHRKQYEYAKHYLPHDAKHKRQESAGKTLADQLAAVVGRPHVETLGNESKELGIQATRVLLDSCDIHEETCGEGVEAVRQYRREWYEDKKAFGKNAVHDWTSHPADALRYLAMAWRSVKKPTLERKKGLKPFTKEWLEYNDESEQKQVRYR